MLTGPYPFPSGFLSIGGGDEDRPGPLLDADGRAGGGESGGSVGGGLVLSPRALRLGCTATPEPTVASVPIDITVSCRPFLRSQLEGGPPPKATPGYRPGCRVTTMNKI